jgi:hypothetical protein
LVVLEENDILHEEIKLLKQKEDIMIKSHQEKGLVISLKNIFILTLKNNFLYSLQAENKAVNVG